MSNQDPTEFILIVDDDPSIIELLQGWVESAGFGTHTASNGQEAIEVARKTNPDAIIMDAAMPIMGGFEALIAMKKDPQLCEIPVVFLTARNDIQDFVTALQTGACDYITKPFKPQLLLARLRASVSQKKKLDILQAHSKFEEERAHALQELLSSMDTAVLTVNLDGYLHDLNTKASEALGSQNGELKDKNLSDILSFDSLPWTTEEPLSGKVSLKEAGTVFNFSSLPYTKQGFVLITLKLN